MPRCHNKRNLVKGLIILFGLGIISVLISRSSVNLNFWFGGLILFFAKILFVAVVFFKSSDTGGGFSKATVGDRRFLKKEMKIVVIGGGAGLGTILRGLKKITSELTAIVTVADDGGSSGRLRQEFGILPPGDIRSCLVAMADLEPLMEQLMQYRFDGGTGLAGHNFGNLFLTAMTNITGDFQKAIEASSQVLAVRGRVFAATLEDVSLTAVLEDGTEIKGESAIGRSKIPIKRVYLQPQEAKAVPESLEAIKEADLIIIGPGSLFTSIIPPLLVKQVLAAVKNAKAKKVFICNVMTQPGETHGFTASDHLRALLEHTGAKTVDYMIINDQEVPPSVREVYAKEGAEPVAIDLEKVISQGVFPITAPLLNTNGLVRHDAHRLANLVLVLLSSIPKGTTGSLQNRWSRFVKKLFF